MKRTTSKAFRYSMALLSSILIFVYFYKDAAPRRQAREIWREHERVVVDAAKGRRVWHDEFHDAVLFFERTAGISVPSEHSTFVDSIPTKETGLAVEPIRRWYQENKYRLYWDEQ